MNQSPSDIPVPFSRPIDRAGQRWTELTLEDGYRTGVLIHRPAGQPAALPVLYVHGIQSHPGWFVGSASELARRGHAVYQVVRRGSGDNQVQRGHAENAEQILADVRTASQFVLNDSKSDRLHAVGISWGGKLLAACAVQKRPAEWASLTMVSPGLAARVDIPARTKFAVALSLLISPRRLFDIPLSDEELFTDNPAMRDYLQGDPCRLHRATARFLYASRELDRIVQKAPAGCLRDLPATLILAENDRIIDNAATAEWLDRLTAGRAAFRTLPGCHTLEFEPDPAPYYTELAKSLLEK